MDNAIKFNRQGGDLHIRTWKSRGKVFVRIQDQGPGIPTDEIKNIWERFYQVEKSRSGLERGTGLGLSIVKKIIDEHQQRIWVHSREGQGQLLYSRWMPNYKHFTNLNWHLLLCLHIVHILLKKHVYNIHIKNRR